MYEVEYNLAKLFMTEGKPYTDLKAAKKYALNAQQLASQETQAGHSESAGDRKQALELVMEIEEKLKKVEESTASSSGTTKSKRFSIFNRKEN